MSDFEENNVCGSCSKVVYGAATVALNRKYHPDCFKCTTCGDALTGEFYEVAGHPFCKRDYAQKNLPTCGLCSQKIDNGATTIFDREGNSYHDTCFCCDRCKGSVVEGYFNVRGQRLCPHCNVANNEERKPIMTELGHCSTCYKRFQPGDEYSSVQNLKYHPPCIKCYYCKKVIDESRDKYEYERVTDILLNFVCQNCLSSGRPDRCAECHKIIIVNSATSAFGKPFHTKCFKCSKCSRQIHSSEVYVKDGNRAICTSCPK